MFNARKTFAAAALVGGLALVAAGCSSEDPETDDTMSAEPTVEAGGELPDPLTLALVPSDEVEQLETDGNALAELLSAELGVTVEIFVPDSYSAVVVALQTGQADIGFLGPIAMWQAHEEAGADIVLQAVRYGSSEYVGQWFTNDPATYCLDEVTTEADEDGIEYSYCNGATGGVGPAGDEALALIDAGETISFVDPTSASGHYFPATQLSEILGVDPLTDFTGSFFAGGHPQSVQAVYDGDATIGISYNDARTNLAEEFSDVGTEVVVFAYTQNIPNDGVVVSGDLDADSQTLITDALLALAGDEAGAAALDAVYEIDGLEPANLDAFEGIVASTYANFGDA